MGYWLGKDNCPARCVRWVGDVLSRPNILAFSSTMQFTMLEAKRRVTSRVDLVSGVAVRSKGQDAVRVSSRCKTYCYFPPVAVALYFLLQSGALR